MKTGIAVIGGGFAGLNLVKHLAQEENFCITLVDVNNYHFFPPLLYQVLPVSSTCPILRIRSENCSTAIRTSASENHHDLDSH
ncbi:Pyridine nucleotide-disulphide oxidoreductase [Nitrosospira sp. Nsp14]|uniref:FAD-dependent oxidoreductase n=1 Tax=Nitrosospira sp. Nsp14 TaxID=1855333 RepID=UPI0008ED3204|nr:FAD-dependent oxidoreductase [Nitrosospira sp. Nsp14]SFH29163.1 Pyridine nucleotide-disulphide oxidoreductase [Nitrosospira sp. Nsp14]